MSKSVIDEIKDYCDEHRIQVQIYPFPKDKRRFEVVFAMDGKENYLSNVLDFIKMSIKDDKKQSFDYRLDLASADTSIIYIMCRERIYNDDGKLIEFGDWASAKMKLILDYYPLSQYINDEYGITSEI